MQSLHHFLLLVSSLSLATSFGIPPPSQLACILDGSPCPTGSTCTQTQTCGGLCLASVTPPPLIPCTVGYNGPCPTGSTCTPTEVCPPETAPCGGACIATNNVPTTTAPLPSITCVVGGGGCPSGSFCTQTETCAGLCISTNGPPPSTSTSESTSSSQSTSTRVPCGGDHGHHCPRKHKCCREDGRHCGHDESCHGFCEPE